MMGGLFGRKVPGGNFGMGAYGLESMKLPAMDTPQQGISYNPQAMAQQPQRRQSFWQGGDKFTLRDGLAGALAVLGDAFSQQAGGGVGAVGGLIQGRMAPLQEAAARAAEERKRAAELADYEAKKGIDARYREPEAPDTFARTLLGAGIDPSSPQGIELYRRRAESMANSQDEFVIVPIPGRGTYAGPKSGLPSVFGQGGGRPAPASEDDWNNASPLGGSGGNVGGGFR